MLQALKKILKSESRNIFLWSLLLTALLPLSFSLFFVNAISKSSLERQILEGLASIADKKANEIEKQIQNSQKLAFLMAQSPLLTNSLKELQQSATTKTAQEGAEYQQIIAALNSYFLDLQTLYKYSDVYLFSDKGELILTAGDKSKQANQEARNLLVGELGKVFKGAITLQDSQISSLVYSDQFSKPQIYIASPIIEKGAVRGVLVLQTDTGFVEKTVQDFSGLGMTGETLIGDLKGNLVEPAIGLRHADIIEFMTQAKNMDNRMIDAFKAATAGSKSSGLMQDYRKKEVLGFARYIPSMNWGMLVKVDVDEAYTPVAKMHRNMVLLGFFTIFGVLFLAYLIGDRLQNSQDKLNRLLIELEAANKAIRHANQAKSHFLSNMSHELRTPLNAVIGYSEIIAEELKEKGWIEYLPDLDKINMAGKNLLALVNNVLDITKIDAGKMGLFLTNTNVKQLLSEIEAIVTPLAQKRNNRFAIYYSQSPYLETIYTDAPKLKQCLLNLIGNACKFTENGTVTLNVDSFEKDEKEWIKFEVVDSGIGISEENLQRLFKAFSQVVSADSQAGTGLGLYLTLQFAHLMGGDISVSSALGKGSTFTLTLPEVYIEKKKSDEDKQTAELKFSRENNPLTAELPSLAKDKKKVLIIDDEKEAQAAILPELEDADFTILQAFNGETGFALAQKYHPDLILLDLILPDVEGWQLLAQLKADDTLRFTPVIMLTKLSAEKFVFSHGITDYLVKPISSQNLIEHIKKAIDLKKINYILLVDDDDDLRHLFSTILQKAGLRVQEATNQREAIEKIQQEIPALVLLDIVMPEVNAFEMIEKLQITPKLNKIPILVLTSSTLSKNELENLQRSALRCFQKSNYHCGALLQEIREIIKH